MAAYHVGCGAFGIYAGTLCPLREDGTQIWRRKSEVTDECILAVIQYFKQEMACNGTVNCHAQYQFGDGTVMNLDISKVV